MRAEHHYDDESLIALLESGNDVSLDPHLLSCDSCSEVATTLRQIAGALKEEDVWDQRELDETAQPETIGALRGYASEMSREDSFAAAHLSTLLAGPRDKWMTNLTAHPELRTAGMVRALIGATDHALDTMPPDAIAIIALATEIADHLPTSAYATDTVAKLRGAAWRERAYALFYVGSYTEAEAAICASERHFGDCVVNEWDLGRADIVHTLVHWATDRTADAVVSGRSAVSRLRDTGDVQRHVSAVMAQAHAQMKQLDYRAALAAMADAHRLHGDRISHDTHARLLANIGVCQRALGDYVGAVESYRLAVVLFDEMGVSTDAARTRLSIAIVLRDAGHLAEASRVAYDIRGTFERLGMASDVAVSDLVLAEMALSNENYVEVEALCRNAIRFFERAGVPYSRRAMTALAYVTEAAHQRRLTPEVVRHVQTYIRKLPSQPTLLFAPLPE